MSFKAKDLHYDDTQPAFLRRLRGELSGSGDSDRHERPIARPKRLEKDVEDDAPTYVLEDSNQTLTKEEYDTLINGKEKGDQEKDDVVKIGEGKGKVVTEIEQPRGKKGITEIGKVTKKKRAIKVVGDDGDDDGEIEEKGNRPIKKAKKKAKPAVKLSFGDEAED